MAEISKIIAGDVTYHLRDRNYCTCSTGADTKAKTASLEGFVLTTGSVVNVKFANSNTASNPTLNINDTGAYAIMKYGSTAPGVTAASSWYAGSVITLIYDGTYWVMVDFNVTGMYIASYGSSTYAEVLEAYQDNKIIYCRASSNTNPATGNQLRMAFLAYVNNQTTPTEFEFQYYRSVNNHSNTQQGDQVYVYKLSKTAGWTVTVRQSYTKIVNGTGLSGSYSSGALTLNHSNSVTAQTTQAIYPIKIDAQGHINSYGSAVTPLTADSTLDATKLSGAVPRASLPSNAEMGQGYGISGNSIVTGGLNLLPYPYAETTKTVNGITFTDNGDGTITIDGTATGAASFFFRQPTPDVTYFVPGASYTYSLGYDFSSQNNTFEVFYKAPGEDGGISFDSYNVLTFDYPSFYQSQGHMFMQLKIASGSSFDNVILYPSMCQSSSQLSPWEPYIQAFNVTLPSYELIEGGIVAVKMNIDVPAGAGMNINSTGVLPIKYKGSAITSNIISSGDTVTFVYSNGSYYLISIDTGGKNGVQSDTISTIWHGTLAEYNSISPKDDNTLYFVDGELQIATLNEVKTYIGIS